MLPWGGLHPAGLHEIKPLTYRDMPSASAIALALAVCRIEGLTQTQVPGSGRKRPACLLWVVCGRYAAEFGRPYGPGLLALGMAPGRVLFVEVSRTSDALWAMEEGLASRVPAAVIGLIDALDGRAARRLALATRSSSTPCLVLTGQDREPAPATCTRWRIGAAASAGHPFDQAAPGARRFALHLERCRQGPSGAAWIVEWCHEARCLRLVSPLAHGAAGTGASRQLAR